MNKKEIKEQLREICTAANSLAGALSSLTVRLSTDIMLDDEVFHHCGQDADMDDACCQARNHNQPEGYTYKDLLGMKVICVGGSAMKCEGCSWDCDNCVKVELAGGDYICLAEPEQEESTTEIDDSPKSFEEAYRDSMNLLREFCIKQSEANQRLVKALKEESEELKKPVINFDEENNDSLCGTMQEIKEKVDDFMDYLDSVVNG